MTYRLSVLKSVFKSALYSVTLLAAGVLLTGQMAHAESTNVDPLKATARLELPTADAKEGTVIIELKLDEPYKAYADRFKLSVEEPAGATLEPFKLGPLVQFMDTFTKKMKDGIKHNGTMTAQIKFSAVDPSKIKLDLTYQACTTEHCLFPKHIKLDPTVVHAGAATSNSAVVSNSQESSRKPSSTSDSDATSSRSPAAAGGGSSEFEKAMSGGLFSAILFMVIAGFLTSLTPCIYPMIPITLAILGASERRAGVRSPGTSHSKFRSFLISVFYVLGIATTYSILGVTAASTGALFGSALSNIYVVSTLGIMFVLMGLSMYGLFEIQAPAFIRDRLGQGKSETGYGSSYLTGLAAGVVASPCIGPVLVSVLAYIAQTQNKLLGLVLLFSFAMGMGVLFIVLGTSSSMISKVPKAGAWMDGVKFVFGSTMIGMAIYYVAPVYPQWAVRGLIGLAMVLIASAYGVFAPAESGTARVRKGASVAAFAIGIALLMASTLEKTGFSMVAAGGSAPGQAAPAKANALNWQPYSAEALDQALNEHKPVLIDFWADWCGACHELEERTFPDARIQSVSKSFALFKIDATTDSPVLDQLKKQYSVMGLPTMIFYDVKGELRRDLTVTGFEEADTFLGRMQKALDNSRSPAAAAN